MIAALFVETNGCYYNLPNVDPWDEKRDARLYAGPYPVVAHPPCAAWCRLAGLRQYKYGYPKGEDGGCFESARDSVKRWGGVLEHPAYSDAWPKFGLIRPQRNQWISDGHNGFVTEASQRTYGHRARKRTWLWAVGIEPLALDWSEPPPLAYVSGSHNHTSMPLGTKRVWTREAKATPLPFRDLLISLAESVNAP
jgi:hypothetical protein